MGHTDRAALIATVKQLWIDANRLCDRQLGGTYESDCRLSLKQAEPAIYAIAALLEAEAWQPIATAPKDGTAPIVGGCHHPVYGWLWGSIRHYDPDIDGGYWVMDGGGVPTHWRPLPAPPVTEVL